MKRIPGRPARTSVDPFARRRLTPLQILLAVFLVGLTLSVEVLLWQAYVSSGRRSASFKQSSITVTNLANVQRETTRLYAESLRVSAGERDVEELRLRRMLVGRQVSIMPAWVAPDDVARVRAILEHYDVAANYFLDGPDDRERSVAARDLAETATALERQVKITYDRHEQHFYRQLAVELRQAAGSQRAVLLLGVVVMAIAAALTLLLRRSVRSAFQRAYEALVHEIEERKTLQGQLEHQAYHDALTGLANRTLYIRRVEEAVTAGRRAGEATGVIFIDLDDFKAVNDTLGHEAGDTLLEQTAKRLTLCLRGEDTAARLGGDEFAVLLEHSSDAERVAQRIMEALRAPVRIADHDLVISASVGIAVGGPEIEFATTLLANADIAMYSAKAKGKSQYAIFATAMQEEVEMRMRVRAEMREALRGDQFTLHYQPIMELDRSECVGAEALVRWTHPTFGLVLPASFIPIAEETGFICELGRFVLDQATMRAASWQRPERRPIHVSVNVSTRQIGDADIVSDVTGALARSGLAPELLTLEITESVLLVDPDAAIDTLTRLKEIGVRIAIDDFGTGYSSLNYLRQLPVDTVKIDKAFIEGLEKGAEESALARAVIEFGAALGLDTVAEGIETAGELDLLIQLQCRYGQGYLLSRPLDGAAIDAFLASRAATSVPEATRSSDRTAGVA